MIGILGLSTHDNVKPVTADLEASAGNARQQRHESTRVRALDKRLTVIVESKLLHFAANSFLGPGVGRSSRIL